MRSSAKLQPGPVVIVAPQFRPDRWRFRRQVTHQFFHDFSTPWESIQAANMKKMHTRHQPAAPDPKAHRVSADPKALGKFSKADHFKSLWAWYGSGSFVQARTLSASGVLSLYLYRSDPCPVFYAAERKIYRSPLIFSVAGEMANDDHDQWLARQRVRYGTVLPLPACGWCSLDWNFAAKHKTPRQAICLRGAVSNISPAIEALTARFCPLPLFSLSPVHVSAARSR